MKYITIFYFLNTRNTDSGQGSSLDPAGKLTQLPIAVGRESLPLQRTQLHALSPLWVSLYRAAPHYTEPGSAMVDAVGQLVLFSMQYN